MVWNKGVPPDPARDLPSPVPVRVRVERQNSMNNRYRPDPTIKYRWAGGRAGPACCRGVGALGAQSTHRQCLDLHGRACPCVPTDAPMHVCMHERMSLSSMA